ncbi:MAG: hypothetical protein QOE20_168 [Mycobacterium sp.]|jgi:hypothetical protein|nr:hypothetical protein [Mycobacterium sp.]
MLDSMRIIFLAVGIVLALFGALWTLQGFGIAPGTFMYENPTWIVIGLVTALVGVAIAVFGWRRGKSS